MYHLLQTGFDNKIINKTCHSLQKNKASNKYIRMVRLKRPTFITLAIWLHWLVISLTLLNQVGFLILKRVF